MSRRVYRSAVSCGCLLLIYFVVNKSTLKMPGLMSVQEFVAETREDYNSPTTSSFVTKIPLCRQTVSSLEEVS